MKLPNFLLIGAQKAGTTSLSHYLSQHPQIYMSPTKEPGFFDFENQPPNFKGPGDQELYSSVVTTLEDYVELFDSVEHESAIGEATTWYLYSKRAPERIKHHIPDVKLIAVLRNPVDRAYSGFMHAVRDNRENLSFSDALALEEQRINDNWEYLWRYQTMGFYAEQLERYFAIFKPEQIRIYLHEDLCENPTGLLQDIFPFLGVSQDHLPEVFTRLNISGKTKSKLLDGLLQDSNPIKQFAKPFFPSKLRKQLANRVRTLNAIKHECPINVRLQLIETYQEDILRVQKLIGRDLSHWLEV
ncbi:MAG: sulfotransferase domain-containing protein [Leptolyngbya sp. SIO1D8]|nr:sulfotransferase domain-containing protein [Leptolyngbya sp. SIO1D8]